MKKINKQELEKKFNEFFGEQDKGYPFDYEDLSNFANHLYNDNKISFDIQEIQSGSDYWLQATIYVDKENNGYTIIFDYDVNSHDQIKDDLIDLVLELEKEARKTIKLFK